MGLFKDAKNFLTGKDVSASRRLEARRKYLTLYPSPGSAIEQSRPLPVTDTLQWAEGLIPPQYGDQETMNAFWKARCHARGTDNLNVLGIGKLPERDVKSAQGPSWGDRPGIVGEAGGKEFAPPFNDPEDLTEEEMERFRMWAGRAPLERPVSPRSAIHYGKPLVAWWGGPHGTLPKGYLEYLRRRKRGRREERVRALVRGEKREKASKLAQSSGDSPARKKKEKKKNNVHRDAWTRSPVRKSRKSRRTIIDSGQASPKKTKTGDERATKSTTSAPKSNSKTQLKRGSTKSSGKPSNSTFFKFKPESRRGGKGALFSHNLLSPRPPPIIKGKESFVALPPRKQGPPSNKRGSPDAALPRAKPSTISESCVGNKAKARAAAPPFPPPLIPKSKPSTKTTATAKLTRPPSPSSSISSSTLPPSPSMKQRRGKARALEPESEDEDEDSDGDDAVSHTASCSTCGGEESDSGSKAEEESSEYPSSFTEDEEPRPKKPGSPPPRPGKVGGR